VDEKTLIQRVRQGDRNALALLLQENYRMILGYFIKITLNKTVAEDLTQETMLRAIEKFGLYQERFKFSTWLITVGTNIYRDQLRKRGGLRDCISGTEMDEIPDPVGYSEPELKTDLRAALGKLAVEKRVVIVLRYFYDYSYEEMAAVLKVPVGTVRSRLHHGIAELQNLLQA
jgi:RNA polymerase sigma-70 factor (ECF subfamily)